MSSLRLAVIATTVSRLEALSTTLPASERAVIEDLARERGGSARRRDRPRDDRQDDLFRPPLGEEQLVALLQESLSVAHRTGAIETKDLERVVVDTTVQEKAIAHPTDALLTHRANEKLVDLTKREGVELRQSYLRVAKRPAIMIGRYTHAHQFKRARRELKFLRVRLGRIIRDIRRRIEGNAALEDRLGPLLDLALRVRHQEQRQRDPKVNSLHAPEVEGLDCHAGHSAQGRTVRAACQGTAGQPV
jgi:IS5 family transposase